MKKTSKMFVATMVVAMVGIGTYVSKTSEKQMSDIALANVEALADDSETDTSKTYSAVKGELYSSGTFTRTKDEYGKCCFKLLINIERTGDCRM